MTDEQMNRLIGEMRRQAFRREHPVAYRRIMKFCIYFFIFVFLFLVITGRAHGTEFEETRFIVDPVNQEFENIVLKSPGINLENWDVMEIHQKGGTYSTVISDLTKWVNNTPGSYFDGKIYCISLKNRGNETVYFWYDPRGNIKMTVIPLQEFDSNN